jgi:aminoglycoside phosphotransferase (APT) family kinase protein
LEPRLRWTRVRGPLAELDVCLAAIAHPARRELRGWLDEHQPEPDRQVVCHGDLHALNVLVNGNSTVLDWELAAVGDAACDIARTKLLLHAVPMELPSAARPFIERLGKRAASRFEDAYTSMSPLPTEAIHWFDALHATRMVGLVLAPRHRRRPRRQRARSVAARAAIARQVRQAHDRDIHDHLSPAVGHHGL